MANTISFGPFADLPLLNSDSNQSIPANGKHPSIAIQGQL